MSGEYAALAGRIREALAELERVIGRAEELADKAGRTGDDGYWDGVALNLHGFYTGVERIFEDIARTLEKNLPDGEQWHIDLLAQMASEVEVGFLSNEGMMASAGGLACRDIGAFKPAQEVIGVSQPIQ